MLEYFGVLATFVQGIENRFDRVQIRLESVENTLYTPAAAAKLVVSEPADRPDFQDNHRSWKYRRKPHIDSDDSFFLDDSRHADCNGRSSRSKRSTATKGAFCALTKDRRHPGLKPLKPTNPRYRQLLSYRYYWLEDTSLERKPRDTSKVKGCIEWMQLSMRNQYFNVDDPILLLNFLAHFVAKANILGKSEAQAYLALPYFSRGAAKD